MLNNFFKSLKQKKSLRQLMRYGLVGAIGAFVDFTLLNIFVFFTPLSIYEDIVLAFLISVIVSYFLHSSWTFSVSHSVNKLMLYSFSSIFGLILNIVIMYFLMEHFGWWYNYAKISAMIVVVIWNYGLARSLIFSR
jgi:putative flippase GtrA